jgi:hypothetical protein
MSGHISTAANRVSLLRLFAIWIVLGSSGLAQQTAQSFEQLRSRVAAGDTLRIRAASAPDIRGRLIEISGTQLSLSAGGATRTFAETQVREVWLQQKDPLANGIWIGLAAGIGAGFLAPAAFCGGFGDPECGAIVRVIFVPIGAGAGALAGLTADVLMKRSVLVYSSAGVRTKLELSPLLAPGRAGFRAALRF